MRWFGIVLSMAGVVAALAAWFAFKNVPVLIGGAVFMVIGMIIFKHGNRSLPK